MSTDRELNPTRLTGMRAPLTQAEVNRAVQRGRALHARYLAEAVGGAMRWLLGRPAKLLAAAILLNETWRQAREINRVDERTLKDLGLTRESFKSAAYGKTSGEAAANDLRRGGAHAA